jgi:hypothetical protein
MKTVETNTVRCIRCCSYIALLQITIVFQKLHTKDKGDNRMADHSRSTDLERHLYEITRERPKKSAWQRYCESFPQSPGCEDPQEIRRYSLDDFDQSMGDAAKPHQIAFDGPEWKQQYDKLYQWLSDKKEQINRSTLGTTYDTTFQEIFSGPYKDVYADKWLYILNNVEQVCLQALSNKKDFSALKEEANKLEKKMNIIYNSSWELCGLVQTIREFKEISQQKYQKDSGKEHYDPAWEQKFAEAIQDNRQFIQDMQYKFENQQDIQDKLDFRKLEEIARDANGWSTYYTMVDNVESDQSSIKERFPELIPYFSTRWEARLSNLKEEVWQEAELNKAITRFGLQLEPDLNEFTDLGPALNKLRLFRNEVADIDYACQRIQTADSAITMLEWTHRSNDLEITNLKGNFEATKQAFFQKVLQSGDVDDRSDPDSLSTISKRMEMTDMPNIMITILDRMYGNDLVIKGLKAEFEAAKQVSEGCDSESSASDNLSLISRRIASMFTPDGMITILDRMYGKDLLAIKRVKDQFEEAKQVPEGCDSESSASGNLSLISGTITELFIARAAIAPVMRTRF